MTSSRRRQGRSSLRRTVFGPGGVRRTPAARHRRRGGRMERQAACVPLGEERGQVPPKHAEDVAPSGGDRRKGDGALPAAAFDGAKARPIRQELSLSQVLEALRNERLGRKRKRGCDGGFTFGTVLDARAARVKQGWRIKDGFTTDGASPHASSTRSTKIGTPTANRRACQREACLPSTS